ncbi:CLUMA_CG006101, isoform A [Clunio marinus]|uniref:CLUMA_CG006101, isoform A n=1 Tax=Clunio marinus TaxID=568069 RepID=A0A1J1I121_9DIPT|nr:CLUMA_CG006101, isoform A [Clunio marinus]
MKNHDGFTLENINFLKAFGRGLVLLIRDNKMSEMTNSSRRNLVILDIFVVEAIHELNNILNIHSAIFNMKI